MAVQQVVSMDSLCSKCHRLATTKVKKQVLKQETRHIWIGLILRTRESTTELQKRIETNNIYVCERHFKAEYVSKFA